MLSACSAHSEMHAVGMLSAMRSSRASVGRAHAQRSRREGREERDQGPVLLESHLHACMHLFEEEQRVSTDALDTIEGMLGRFNGPARDAVTRAITDDAAGCTALAWKITKRSGVKNPAGIFLSCVAAGEHRVNATSGRPAPEPSQRRTPVEKARGLYEVKLAELDRRATHWTTTQRHEFALDYALDHCGSQDVRPGDVVPQGVQLGADDGQDIPW